MSATITMESCSCHKKRIDENKSNKKAILRLVIACIMALIFVIVESIGEPLKIFKKLSCSVRWIYFSQSCNND